MPPVLQEIVCSLAVVREVQLLPATLTLLYSGIDTLAFYAMPEKDSSGAIKEDVTRADFLRWAEEYVLRGSGLPCSGIDLYAARCSWVHGHRFEGRLHREGKARMLFYGWGTSNLATLQNYIDTSMFKGKAVAVNLDRLAHSFIVGAKRFWEEIDQDPHRKALFQNRHRMGVTHRIEDGTQPGGFIGRSALTAGITATALERARQRTDALSNWFGSAPGTALP